MEAAIDEHLSQQQQQQEQEAAVAAAAAAAAVQLGLGDLQSPHPYHALQQPDFGHHKDDGTEHHHTEVDVHALEIPVEPTDDVGLHHHHHHHHHSADPDLDLSLSIAASPHVVEATQRAAYGGRPPSIRKGK
jgi:hypothetical protein